MDVGETQLIGDSPPRSSGYDSPMHEPTQLLYTQLFDQYEGPMNNSHKRQHLDLDMETQLIDEHNFDDFRKNGRLIVPCEDEASKETQLIHGDEVHSGSSSGKDGEVDSALSPFSSAFSQKPSHWLTEFTHRDRSIEGVSGRAQVNFPFRDRYLGQTQILLDDENDGAHIHSAKDQRKFVGHRAGGASSYPDLQNRDEGVSGRAQVNFPFRDRYLGETQILADYENDGAHDHSAKDQRKFVGHRAGSTSSYPDLQNRDGDVPHFLKDFDPNRQDFAGQGTVGSWQEVTGQSEDRGWETAVRSLQLVDSDASTEDETENHNNSVFNTDPGHAQLTQTVNPRSSTRVSNLFCKQDLNKSPEPEFMMDGWEEENRADLGIGRIDEGGSNVELLNEVERVGQSSESTPMETGINEALNGRTTGSPELMFRTAGSIRAESLHASSLQASAPSSSGRYLYSIPQGSKSEEVQNVERDATNIEVPRDVPLKVRGASGDTTASERGHSAASSPSVLSDMNRDADSRRIDKDLETVKVMDRVDAKIRDLPKVGRSMQGEASSVLGPEVSKPTAEKRIQATEDDHEDARSQPSFERINPGKESEAELSPPGETRSSPAGKSLERRSSFGSGLFSGGSDMSYLSTQSPGEDSQARALNMVDKLVWLNAIGLPQELQLEDEKSPLRAPSHAKSVLQSRIQVAEAKAGMDDPFGVFDWVDSQNDEAGAFFGGGTTRASASKGSSKALIDVGQPKQSAFGFKKAGVGDVPGTRNKKAKKLPEKVKFLKQTPNTDKPKGFVSKNPPGGTEVKNELQGSRPGNGSGAVDIRQEQGCTEAAALDFTDSRHERLGSETDKRSGLSDKCLNKFGAMDNSSTAEKMRLVSTFKVPPHQQRSKPLADQARPEKSSNANRFEYSKEPTNPLKDPSKALDVHKETGDNRVDKQRGDSENLHKEHGPPSAQSRSSFGPKAFHDAQTSIVAEASGGNVHCLLQETSDLDTMEGGLMQQAIGDAGSSHQITGNEVFSTIESGSERIPRMPYKANCSPPLQKGGSSELAQTVGGHVEKLSEVSPEKCPQNGEVLENVNDFVDLHQISDLQQRSNEDDVGNGNLFERVENHHGSSRPNLDGTKLQAITDCKHSRLDGHLEGSLPVSVNVSTTDQSEGQDSLAKLAIPDADTGPGTAEAVIERTVKSPKSSSTGGSCEVSLKEEGNENIAVTSDLVSLKIDIKDERKPTVEHEIQSAPPKATRRGRSQTRYSSKPLENANPSSGRNSFTSREKGRGRRVTWAGPLVDDLRRQSIGLRSPRISRQQIEVTEEDVEDSAADSSDQEEESEDVKEPKAETVSRRRNSEASETGSSYSDLDKIKRRFNMSDAAVARLLGTDEEEESDLINTTTGVKVRSLSHIQPEADGNGDEITAPNFRRVSKGLRSARSRSEEGVRRPWPFTSSDQGKLNGEEVVSPPDESAIPAGNMNGTVAGDCHPSDNEFMTGRRRMRSIVDVSFSNLPQTTSGRPPLARGLRRKRPRHVFISPPEAITDPSDDDLPPAPPLISPLLGRFRGKGGPRSARKRKEPESDLMPSTSELSMSPNSSKETSPTSFKRRRRTGAISVLLSHGLNEDTIKQQKKIVAKLGGRVATSASECSHFVADKFVRTGNMLEAMASGKPVVHIGWLETCSEANRFVDEEDFILQDAKKEEEMGFSMVSTLAAARQRPLLQGIRVYITPGTSPGPDSLGRIVKSAGGQVVDQYCGPPPDGEQESNFCVVISSEDEFEDCIPLLEQGAKVYTPELILSGVTSYHLDFSNDQLFKNFAIRRRRGSSSRRTA